MTLAPLVDPSIHGVEGKPVELSRHCVTPGCISLAQQRHHLWPKSFLRGQPYEWVSVQGHVMANSVGLCIRHHSMVTGGIGGHMGKITYSTKLRIFEWWEEKEEDGWKKWLSHGPLRGQALVEPVPEARRVRREEGLCPTCGRAAPKERKTVDGHPKRKAKTWGILVPDDEEIGADVLDVYIEDLGVLMGLNADSPRLLRYHVLVPVLEWVTQQKPQFIHDWEEASA